MLLFKPERFMQFPDVDIDVRPRDPSCTTPMPEGVDSCRRIAARSADYCKDPQTCPAIPESWTVRSVGGVTFADNVSDERAPGVRRRYQLRSSTPTTLDITPGARDALAAFVAFMNIAGLPMTTILTDGGRYCRCVKRPEGVCKSDGTDCTSNDLSNHAYGDAVDIRGVKWVDHVAAGSSLRATLEKSWNDDPPEQSALVVRINAALRLSFKTVFDYSRDDSHRWHFHCDTNRGGAHPNWWDASGDPTDPCEPYFIWGALKRLGYVARTTANRRVTWSKARTGLDAFRARANLPQPTTNDPPAWRPVINSLFLCTLMGSPISCRP